MARWLQNGLAYFITLVRLFAGWKEIDRHLDLPLQAAVVRARWSVGWTVATLAAGALIAHPNALRSVARLLTNRLHTPSTTWFVGIAGSVIALALAITVAYGLLRMYTLITHVLVTNVFKTRGQRLRLLNAQATLLPLSAPTGFALALSPSAPDVTWGLFVAIIMYAATLLSYAYNRIFHQHRLRGFLLLVEGTLLTWFVIAIGALAIAVALAVIAFFVVLVLRAFTHGTAN